MPYTRVLYILYKSASWYIKEAYDLHRHTLINADKYAYFMINADKNADSMFNTENFKYNHQILSSQDSALQRTVQLNFITQ